jgi:hypothetical protein
MGYNRALVTVCHLPSLIADVSWDLTCLSTEYRVEELAGTLQYMTCSS